MADKPDAVLAAMALGLAMAYQQWVAHTVYCFTLTRVAERQPGSSATTATLSHVPEYEPSWQLLGRSRWSGCAGARQFRCSGLA